MGKMRSTENISFVIPAFNCARTLEETVRSIIDGNLSKGDEIVIVNDGSTDGTGELAARVKKRHGCVTAIDHPTNRGGAAARNTAVEHATNDLIFCLDSDNVLVAQTISPLKDCLIRSGASAAAFQALHYFKDNRATVTHKWIFKTGIHTLADSLAGFVTPVASGNYLYTKECWRMAGGYPGFAKALDAWGFGIRQLATGAKMVVAPNLFYLHRYGHASYWIRSSDDKNEIAYRVLEPFMHLIVEADAEYIRNNKDKWFSNLARRPIRIKNEKPGVSGSASAPSLMARLLGKINRHLRASANVC
jgi:glycosyltransferase involved in cell wall biosynthesis